MKKGAILFLFVALAFVMFSAPSFADSVDKATDAMQEGQDMMDKGQGAMDKGKKMMDMKDAEVMEATVTCIQVDQGGTLTNLTEFDECTGTMVVVTADKSAAVVAPKSKSKAMKGGKQTVEGELAGHTRGYILASASALDDKGASQTVEGTIVCLLPNYEDGTVQPVVATSPCGEHGQHLHVVKTKSGQVYALHGTEDAIKQLEATSDRKNVSLEGKILGEQGAWVLYVN
jgi:RecJ-like exonuclease